MKPLSQTDCRALYSTLEKIYSITSLEAFPSRVLSATRQLFPCDIACYNEIILPNTVANWITDPVNALGPILKEMFLRNYTEHPALAYYAQTGDGRSCRISDFISSSQFHNLTLYNEYFRQSNIEYQMLAGLMLSPNQMVGIVLDRDCTNFTEEERLNLDLLRPHLIQAYRNLQALDLMKRVVEGRGEKIVIVSRSGQVRLASDDVWRILVSYFNMPSSQNSLPEILNSWVIHERSRFSDEFDIPFPSIPLVVRKGYQKLIIHFLWGGKTVDQDLLLLVEVKEELTSGLSDESGLTGREAEILAWLSQGKTNIEIGQILSISPRTVKKHLEHIYHKLHVHRRTAAVARSLP
jgi:DNA-binding CsgD family transcriptional regulator